MHRGSKELNDAINNINNAALNSVISVRQLLYYVLYMPHLI